MCRTFIRKSTHPVSALLNKIGTNKGEYKTTFYGDTVTIRGLRYLTFKTKGYKCVSCGVEAAYIAKERAPQNQAYQLNMYAVVDDQEILMTVDHIIPRARGGPDRLENLQPMCELCNVRKADKMP